MDAHAQNSVMLRGPVIATFFRYGLPWAFAMLLASSAGVVDGFFIGRYAGASALAALNIIMPTFSLLMGLVIMAASGGAVRCAHYRGQGREMRACAVFTKTMVALLGIGVVGAALCIIFLKNIVLLLGADAALAPLAEGYLRIVALFFPMFTLEVGLSYFVRVDERPVLAAVGLMGSAVINIVLDYVFIARFGLGIEGAAWATGIGYSIMFVLVALARLTGTGRRLQFTRAIGKWKELWQASWNGISEMINELSTGTVMLMTNLIMMQRMGADGVAAFTVINYTIWLCLMLTCGISDSLAPLVGVNAGAGNTARVRAFLRVALGTAFVVGLTCFCAMTFFPAQLVGIFLPGEGAAVTLSMQYMEVVRFIFFFCGANIVLTAYFTGLLQAAASALVAVLRSLLLPILFLWMLPSMLGDTGIFVALPLAEIVTLPVALFICHRLHCLQNKRAAVASC